MALGDGTTWDETTPTDSSWGYNLDDYNRDLRVGLRSRLALEHEFPSSQTATSEGGKHKFVTLQSQATKPTLSGTQVSAVYVKNTGNNLFYENSAATEHFIAIHSTTGVEQTVLQCGGTDQNSVWNGVAVKAHVVFCATSSSPITPFYSYGISGSVVKDSTGTFTITWATPFTDEHYSVHPSMMGAGFHEVQAITSGAATVQFRNSSGTLVNPPYVSVIAIGVQ